MKKCDWHEDDCPARGEDDTCLESGPTCGYIRRTNPYVWEKIREALKKSIPENVPAKKQATHK